MAMSPGSNELHLATMLERETETIIHTLTEQTIGSARSLALKDALAASMPRSVKWYLHSEVAHLMLEDLQGTSHFSKLPFTAPVVHRITLAYTMTLAPEYILTREEFITLLENGVHFVENYLCRPQWTLEQFLFEKGPRATLSDVQRKFGYLCEYTYFGRLVEGFMRRKGWQEIGVEDFRSLIGKIDDRVVRQHDSRELAQLTKPIFEFLLLQPEVANKPIPIRPLLMFFEDKKMKVEMDYTEQLCHIRSTDQLTIEQLAAIMEDLHGTTTGKATPLKEAAFSPSDPVAPDSPAEPVPAQSSVSQTDAPGPELAREDIVVPAVDRRNIALSLTYSGMADNAPQPSPAVIQDLRTAFSGEQRDRFIRSIFQEDESYYTVVVETLNDMRTWKDASLYLHTFLRTTGIDPDLPEVIEFNNIVHLRYPSQQQP